MEEENISQNIKIARTEAEKKRQKEAHDALMYPWPLPKNISDMKTYAWGKFTWRDVIVSSMCLIVPELLMMAFQVFIPLWLCIIIGVGIAIPLVLLANKHKFTGELPIEDRIKIYLNNAGESNLLSWDKTKQNGHYIPSSTQSFVPEVSFTDSNYVMLPNDQGGFAILQLFVEDSSEAKPTDKRNMLIHFQDMLNSTIDNSKCTPVQIYMKSDQRKLDGFVDNALDDIQRAQRQGKPTMSTRATDYANMLLSIDRNIGYTYRYYIIVTYRSDAEGVGDSTMNTMSVKREQMKEKVNPFQKKMEAAESIDYKIGDDRKKKSAEYMKSSEFGKARTKAELDRRVTSIKMMCDDMGTTHTNVSAQLLDNVSASKLFYECFNQTDKYTVNAVLTQAVDKKTTLWSESVYDDFPDMFVKPEEKETDAEAYIRRRQALMNGGDEQ